MWGGGGLAHRAEGLLDPVLPAPRRGDKEALCSSHLPAPRPFHSAVPHPLYPHRKGQPLFPVSLDPCQTPHIGALSTARLGGLWASCAIASGGIGALGTHPHISTRAPPTFSDLTLCSLWTLTLPAG